MARVRIHVLGGFRIVVDGRELRLRTRKEAMVLLRLALAGERGVSRDDLLAMLWPESSETRARHSLSEALRGIEQATPIEIVRSHERLALPAGVVSLDSDDLDEAMQKGDVAQCATLYVGGFLAGWYPPTPEASHWVDSQGARIARTIEKSTRAQLESRRRATDSHGVVAAVALLEKLGVVTEADREAGVEAEQITRWESLRPGEALQAPLPLDREGPFVGRTEEMKLLTSELDRALAGELRVVLVSGEAGIGKTRTCQRLARLAALRGCRLFMSTCYELEQSVAFGAIGEAFGGAITPSDLAGLKPLWQQVLGEVFPAFAALTGQALQSPSSDVASRETWILEATRSLIEALCGSRPGLLLVDDLQWGDSVSCRILHHIIRRAEPTGGLLIVLIYRDVALDSSPRSLLQSISGVQLTLGPLGTEETQEQIARISGVVDPIRLGRLTKHARGNPFFARELAIAGSELGDFPPASVQDLVLSRTQKLSPQQHEVLALVVVAGGRLHIEALAAAMDVRPAILLAPVSILRERGLIQEETVHLVVDHELIRSCIYASLGEPLRRSLHKRLAEARSPHITPAARAKHFEVGGYHQQASQTARSAAGDPALRYAAEERLELLSIALRTAEGAALHEAAEAYAEACADAGQYGRMLETIPPAIRSHEPVAVKLQIAKLKRANLKDFATLPDAVSAIDAVLSRAARSSPGDFLESVREKLRYGHEAQDRPTVLAAIGDLSDFAASHPGTTEAGRALCLAAYQRVYYAPGPDIDASLRTALALGRRLMNPQLQAQAEIGLAMWAIANGRTNTGHNYASSAMRVCRRYGLVAEEMRARVLLMCAELDRMRFRRVVRHATVLQGRGNPQDHWNAVMLGRLNAAAALLQLGEFARAEEEAHAVIRLEEGHPDWLARVNASAIAGIAALYLGRTREARSRYAAVRPEVSNLGAWMDDPSHVLTFVVSLYLRDQRGKEALRLARQVADGCKGRNAPGYWTATLLAAEVSRTLDEPIDHAELLRIRSEASAEGNLWVVDRAATELRR